MPSSESLLDNAGFFQSPSVYPERVDAKNRRLELCEMSIKSFTETPFLDHRMVRAGSGRHSLGFDAILQHPNLPEPQPASFIFHSAFCCSTLMTRYLDALDRFLVLREPHSIYEIASLQRFHGKNVLPDVTADEWQALYRLIMLLLVRRFDNNAPVVMKPSDGCNNLMANMLGEHADNTGLFIYTSLERFLVSVLKQDDRHEWAAIRARELTLDLLHNSIQPKVSPIGLGPGQNAALVWVLQMDSYRALHEGPYGKRIRCLNSSDFLDDPVAVITALTSHFGHPVPADTVAELLSAANLEVHSKLPSQHYDQQTREREFREERGKYDERITRIMQWAESVFGSESLKAPLPGALTL